MSENQETPQFFIEFSDPKDIQFQSQSRMVLKSLISKTQEQNPDLLKTDLEIETAINNTYVYDNPDLHNKILDMVGAKPKSLFAKVISQIGKNRGMHIPLQAKNGTRYHAVYVNDRNNPELLIHELQHTADSILEREEVKNTQADKDI